jgi:osmotically-inducible protein OsmY
MANQQHGNGRNPGDDERLAARDRERMGSQWDDRSGRWDDREDRNRSTEYYGQGQSGYGAGRDERDHAFGSRNQMNPIGDERNRDRGTDDRFTGRGGSAWSPDDRSAAHPGGGGYGQGREGHGNQSNYGSPGNVRAVGDGETYGHQGTYSGQDSSYLAQSGQQMSYRDRDEQIGGRGAQGQGGMYGQGGYNDGMYGRGGMQHRYGSQGYQGWGQPQHGAQPRGGMPSPGHRGKGPSGYRRSDDRIRENVCEALMDDDHVDATHIDVSVKNGEVTLSGTVEDRQQKRIAEDCIENVAGVQDVVNQLRIGAGNGHASTQVSSDKRHRA